MTSKKTKAGPISAERLKSFVERIEKLEEERKAIGGDIKDVYSEAKGVGYDVKTMRKVVGERRMNAADRAEQETLLDVYRHALGMAVNDVAGGASLRTAAKTHGVSKSALGRVVPRDKKPKAGTAGSLQVETPAAATTLPAGTPGKDQQTPEAVPAGEGERTAELTSSVTSPPANQVVADAPAVASNPVLEKIRRDLAEGKIAVPVSQPSAIFQRMRGAMAEETAMPAGSVLQDLNGQPLGFDAGAAGGGVFAKLGGKDAPAAPAGGGDDWPAMPAALRRS